MGVLLERKSQVIFVTASSVKENGKAREVIVEGRPQYAVVQRQEELLKLSSLPSVRPQFSVPAHSAPQE